MIRLHTIIEFGTSTNPTYDYTSLAVWSLIEIDVGVICACMPGIASLYQRLRPRLFSRGSGASADSYSYQRKGTGNSGGSSNSGGSQGLEAYRAKRGFARMDESYGGYHQGHDAKRDMDGTTASYNNVGGNHQHNISKTTSVTVSYVDPAGVQYDSKSDELELVERPSNYGRRPSADDLEMNVAADGKADHPPAHPYQPGTETRNYRRNW